jgi:hypothetical protein
VYTEERTVLRAVTTDFYFKCWKLEIRINVFGTYQGASTIMCNTLDWKRSRISMFEVEAVPQQLYFIGPDWFEYCFVYENVVACGEF